MPRKKRKKSGEPHPHGDNLRELGSKQRAGRALSELLRAIGQEKTEVVCDQTAGDSDAPGPPRIVSKAEAMARYIWSQAVPREIAGEAIEPDKDYVRIVLERCEGKPGTIKDVEDQRGEELPDKIARLNLERLNAGVEE